MSAPVTLITGLPGNGKTLYALTIIKERAEKENRQVYYHGIEILDKQALPWLEFEYQDWHKLPAGAMIVIDEAHKVFPVRPTGSKVPEHVLPIAELRHEGFDMYLITQHPMELDSAVRRRVGRHLHVERRFGLERSAIYEWSKVRENCDKTKKDAILSEWAFNTKAYAWYKSAEIHTIKRRLPLRLLWLVAAGLMIPVAIGYVWHVYSKQRAIHPAVEQSRAVSGRVGDVALSGTDAYVKSFQPRVPGLAYTAPVYDSVTKPTRAPVPAACVESKTRCQCYSQQGTKLEVPKGLCHDIADGGFFMAWEDQKPLNQPGMQAVQPARVPVAQVSAEGAQPTGLGGFATTNRLASAEPVSVTNPVSQDQSGRGRAIAR